MKKILLSLGLVLIITSCKNKTDFSQLKTGMTFEEVETIVGAPKDKTDTGILGTWYVYKEHIVIFVNDTVAIISTKDEMKDAFQDMEKKVLFDGLDEYIDILKD